MITTLFLNLFFILIVKMLDLLPNLSSTSSFGTAIHNASGYISSIYGFLPVITIAILGILSLDVLFETSYFIYKGVYWIIRRFPSQS